MKTTLLDACVYVAVCVLGVGAQLQPGTPGYVWRPCEALPNHTPIQKCGILGPRPYGYDVTKYCDGTWNNQTLQSCASGKVYNQQTCTCVDKPDCTVTSAPDHSTWMNDLPTSIKNKPLNRLAIPGSHDSATAYMTSNSPTSPDLPYNAWGNTYNAYQWSRTQGLTITAQLNAGIRYLDLRVAYKGADDTFYFVHGLYCVNATSAMIEVKTFITAHENEVVLLDFNHFYDIDAPLHTRLRNELSSLFGTKVCPVTPMSKLTLTNLNAQGRQVVIFYQSTLGTSSNRFWPATIITAPWANTLSITNMTAYLQNSQPLATSSIFHVSQGVLTPTPSFGNARYGQSLRNVLAIPALEVYLAWVKNKISSPANHTIFMCDFVEQCNFIEEVIKLNNHISHITR